jgi:hypothetical protein
MAVDASRAPAPLPIWARLAAVTLLIVVLLAGLWFFGGIVAPG